MISRFQFCFGEQVHPEATSNYRMAFHMLWRLKRVEWSLAAAWKQLMALAHSAWRGHGRDGRGAWRQEFPRLLPVLHRCALGRARMMHVVNNLCAFLMFEVKDTRETSICFCVCQFDRTCCMEGHGICVGHVGTEERACQVHR